MNWLIAGFDHPFFLLRVWSRVLHVVFSCAEDLPLAVLLLFCSEGDNIPDAFTLVNHLNDWLHLLDTPVSDESEEQTAVVHLDDRAFSTFHYGEKMTSTACILRLYISNYGFFFWIHISEPKAQPMEDPDFLESSVWQRHPSGTLLIHTYFVFAIFSCVISVWGLQQVKTLKTHKCFLCIRDMTSLHFSANSSPRSNLVSIYLVWT